MSWIVLIWVVIIVIRLIGPALFSSGGQIADGAGRATQAAGGFLNRRGMVAGHRGPDPRSFKGRAGRGEWWIALVWNSFVGAIIAAIPTVGPILSLPWIIANLAVNARRLHDLKLSAWLQLIPMIATAAALAIYETNERSLIGGLDIRGWRLSGEAMVFAAGVVAGLSWGLFYIWLGFVPGTRGSNHYGEADPIAGAARA